MLAQSGPQHWWPGETSFEVMIGAILTQNTAWTNVEKAIANLKQAGVVSPKKLNQAPLSKLKKWLLPSGFFNVKAKRLKHFLEFFRSKFGYSLEKMRKKETRTLRQELLSVNGIGKETADSILLYALKKSIFVVDAYTRRIFSRHGLIKKDMPYDEIRQWFELNLPRSQKLFNDYHAQIVRVAKKYCRKNPDCSYCPLEFLFRVPGLRNSPKSE